MYSAMFLSVLDGVSLLLACSLSLLDAASHKPRTRACVSIVGLAGASPGWGSPPLWFGLGFYGDTGKVTANFLDSVSA